MGVLELAMWFGSIYIGIELFKKLGMVLIELYKELKK